jgi:hypothetical protein
VGILIALGAAYAAGHYPRSHPLVPALAFKLRLPTSSHVRMPESAATYGGTYTVSGNSHGDGTVVAEGRWNDGAWEFLGSATTDGTYSVTFPIQQHGSLSLRVRYPGGEADGTILVP